MSFPTSEKILFWCVGLMEKMTFNAKLQKVVVSQNFRGFADS